MVYYTTKTNKEQTIILDLIVYQLKQSRNTSK